MLADDISLANIDGRHVRGWVELLIPPALAEVPRWALVVLERGQPLHAVRRDEGAIELERLRFAGTARSELRSLRRRLKADVLFVLERETLARISAEADGAIELGDHYTAQSLCWLDAFRRELGSGLWLDPPLADLIPPLSADALDRTFDLLVPDNSAMAAYIVSDDRRELAASVIAVKRGGRIVEVGTHRAIADRLPERSLARGWTTQYRRAGDLIGERFADLSIALWAERSAVRRVLSGPADQLAREMSAKNLIIDPMPRWLAALIGGANAAAIAGRGARRLGALLPESARRAARAVAAETQRRARASGAHPWQVLGFDPLDLWRKLRSAYTPVKN